MKQFTDVDSSLIKMIEGVLEESNKPPPEVAAENRSNPIWNQAFDVHGSSSLMPDTTPENMVMQHQYFHKVKNQWMFGIKEKVPHGDEPHEVKHITTTQHFVERITNPDRNLKSVSGADIMAMKQRVIDQINKDKLVGTKSHGVDFREQHFTSSRHPATKGHTMITRIHPNGNVEFTTFYNDLMSDTVGKHMKTMVESVEEEVIYIF